MRRKKLSKRAAAPTCREMTQLILGYLNNRLQPALKHEFERHLSICPDCVNFLKTYRKTMSAARSLEARQIPQRLQVNVLSFLRKRMHRLGVLFLYFLTHIAG